MKPSEKSATARVTAPRLVAWVIVGIVGWTGGGGLQRWLEVVETRPPASPALRETKQAPAVIATVDELAQVANFKSDDTLDDLLAAEDSELYGRLALWLLDAPLADVERFWSAYQKGREPDPPAADLLFARWTRLDPEGALRLAGASHQWRVWWGWALNDPLTAIARVAELAPEHEDSVLRALGQFHPKLAARMLAEHPEFMGQSAIQDLADGLARTDPAAALDFLRQQDYGDSSKLLREWARDDPRAAFEWPQKWLGGFATTQQLMSVIDTLERENPAALRELASDQPPGALRRQMEAAAFRSLLDSDPAEALRQARATESPRVAAERMAELAQRMVAQDSAQAFVLFAELLDRYPNALCDQNTVEYPDGGEFEGPPKAVSELADKLLGIDPRRVQASAMAARVEHAEGGWRKRINE
jgi:hypothetical protein